ncbi:uncharacterized protein LOC143225531 [Tachypleus tridentatus]|uniref:uncharacterized protein LOC143225531 n=1 Tax=Tachypleus tridentatus TaxID=6853 RepID=UPI003FD3950A
MTMGMRVHVIFSLLMAICLFVTSATTSATKEVISKQGSTDIAVKTNLPSQNRIITKLLGLGVGVEAVNTIYNALSTATGVLAAIGGGYLLHVLLVAIFGETFGLTTGYHYGIPTYSYAGSLNPLYYDPHRKSEKAFRYNLWKFPVFDFQNFLGTITSQDYAERSFRMLGIKEKKCKERAICEFEQFFRKIGIPGVILKSLSFKIPGMEKYSAAISRGLYKEECWKSYLKCSSSLGQMMKKAVGLA